MIAVQGNKEYTIQPEQAEQYAAAGYDILDKGKVVRHAANKTVPFAKYEELLKEVERLKKQLKKAAK